MDFHRHTLADPVLVDALGVRALLTRLPAQPGDVPQTYADIEKARSLLGYDPATPLDVGLAIVARWVRSRSLAEKPASEPKAQSI